MCWLQVADFGLSKSLVPVEKHGQLSNTMSMTATYKLTGETGSYRCVSDCACGEGCGGCDPCWLVVTQALVGSMPTATSLRLRLHSLDFGWVGLSGDGEDPLC